MKHQVDQTALLRDELLVVRCQLGEPQAFEELVQTWSGPLLCHVRRVARDDGTDDVAQEVWLRALRGIGRLRHGAKLRPWLYGIAHRVLMDRLRLRYVEQDVLTKLAHEPAAQVDDLREPLFELIEEELARLPIVERETLALFYLEDLSLMDIALIQGIPAGTVKSRLFRARAMLRNSMLKGADHER